MAVNLSFQTFLNALKDRVDNFNQTFELTVFALTDEDLSKKYDAVKLLENTLQDTMRILSPTDQPQWAKHLIGVLHGINSANRSFAINKQLVISVLYDYQLSKSETWKVSQTQEIQPVLFDTIYEKHFNSSKIPDIFDRLVIKLQEILDSGLVDSNKAIEALKKLIATINRNKRGSYFETVLTWGFLTRFTQSLVWNAIKATPYLGEVVTSFQETMNELKPEFTDVQARIKKEVEVETTLDLSMPQIEHEPQKSLPALRKE